MKENSFKLPERNLVHMGSSNTWLTNWLWNEWKSVSSPTLPMVNGCALPELKLFTFLPGYSTVIASLVIGNSLFQKQPLKGKDLEKHSTSPRISQLFPEDQKGKMGSVEGGLNRVSAVKTETLVSLTSSMAFLKVTKGTPGRSSLITVLVGRELLTVGPLTFPLESLILWFSIVLGWHPDVSPVRGGEKIPRTGSEMAFLVGFQTQISFY